MNEVKRRLLTGNTVDHPGVGLADTTSGTGDLTDQLRQAWQRGDRTPAEIFVRRVEQSSRNEETILDLIYAEFVIREEMGETPETDDYLRRFPKYRQRLERLFIVDRALWDTSTTRSLTQAPVESEPAAPPRALQEPAPRECIGRYVVTSRLPGGGQGEVCRALHPTLGREVVIKIPKKTFAGPDHERERLINEGRLLADLQHPHIARVFDLDFHDGRPFLVLEYVPGRNLEQEVQQQRLTPYRAAWLLAQVASALSQAHRQGILHRDIKPRNIMLDPQGNVKLIDFGLARLQSAWSDQAEPEGAVMGSVQFMAPEQARGQNERVSPRTDLYALGGILYYLLTGVPPHKGRDFTETLNLAREGEVDLSLLERAAAPASLKRLCRQLLETDPGRRPASAEEVAQKLGAIAGGSGTWSPIAIAVGVVLLGVLGLLWVYPREAPLPAPIPVPVAEKKDDGKTRLWVEGGMGIQGYTDLVQLAPLRTGAEVRMRAQVPAGLHAALVSFSSDGNFEMLASAAAVAEPRELTFPPDVHQAVPLSGPPGTEVVLLAASKERPVTLEDVKAVWGETTKLPPLPPNSILRLRLDEIQKQEAKNRGWGGPISRDNPEGEVRKRLEEIRRRFRQHFDYVEGLVFAHVDSDSGSLGEKLTHPKR